MEKNIGWFERALRVVTGGLLLSSAGLGEPMVFTGAWTWIGAAAGIALVWTGVTGKCWLYGYVDGLVEKSGEKAKKATKGNY